MRVPWTVKRTNLSILKEINPECSLEGQILKLRFQYFGHEKRGLPGRDPDGKNVKARGEGDNRERDGWTASLKQPTGI